MDAVLGAAAPLSVQRARAITDALAAHHPRSVDHPGRRQAAVLIVLYERDHEPWVVLTKRTESVATHKGQISFPGGAKDPEDADLWATAVRETVEELGVEPATVVKLGRLDDYPTFSSGFVVTPHIATMHPPEAWNPNPFEIAEVIELPLRVLADIARVEWWERDGIRFPMHIFEVEHHYVWGVTAFILHRFFEVVGPVIGHTVEQA